MNNRRQAVIESAHQVFSEKGYRATSIQNILDRSSISKGTLYKYFSSKSDIILAVFKWITNNIEQARDEILLYRDPSDLETLTEQLILQVEQLETYKMFSLFQEIIYSEETELKMFMKEQQQNELRWIHRRLNDIFAEESAPYLLDCAVMLTGILFIHLRLFSAAPIKAGKSRKDVVRYCMNRLVELVDQVTKHKEQLLDPTLLVQWDSERIKNEDLLKEKLEQALHELKQLILKHVPQSEQQKYKERLDFLSEELIQQTEPRTFIVDSIIDSLILDAQPEWQEQMNVLKLKISDFLKKNQ